MDMERDRQELAQDLPPSEVNKQQVERLMRTCGMRVGDAPCGAAASHVVVLGVRDPDPRVSTASVCEKHLPPPEAIEGVE
jgi:hypothetical protein